MLGYALRDFWIDSSSQAKQSNLSREMGLRELFVRGFEEQQVLSRSSSMLLYPISRDRNSPVATRCGPSILRHYGMSSHDSPCSAANTFPVSPQQALELARSQHIGSGASWRYKSRVRSVGPSRPAMIPVRHQQRHTI